MKSDTMIVHDRTLSEHTIMVILHFRVKNVVFEQNNFISQNYQSFIKTTVMGTENMFCKFDLNQIIFPDFTCIGSLKYKEIRESGAKKF